MNYNSLITQLDNVAIIVYTDNIITKENKMNEWTDGSLINNEAIDKLTSEQVDALLELLKDI